MFKKIERDLHNHQYTWLITGVAGFIGSHLLESLLKYKQKVIGLDNYFSGFEDNLKQVKDIVGTANWKNFTFVEEDVRNKEVCYQLTKGVDFVLHQAALASVPRSIEDPILTNDINVTGSLNVAKASVDNGVKRLIYASSSAVYGLDSVSAKKEDETGGFLSPYAVSKYLFELYAENFAKIYGFESVGLRYFNIFGSRQDPDGAYAAVIPKWISAMLNNDPVIIYGDGENTRDYCHVKNVVQANILAALAPKIESLHQTFNIGCGLRTDLNQLFKALKNMLISQYPHLKDCAPVYEAPRQGDIVHSLADIAKAQVHLKYTPEVLTNAGLTKSIVWYKENV